MNEALTFNAVPRDASRPVTIASRIADFVARRLAPLPGRCRCCGTALAPCDTECADCWDARTW